MLQWQKIYDNLEFAFLQEDRNIPKQIYTLVDAQIYALHAIVSVSYDGLYKCL